jgi:hypothetical protein
MSAATSPTKLKLGAEPKKLVLLALFERCAGAASGFYDGNSCRS